MKDNPLLDRWLHAEGDLTGDEYIVRLISPCCIIRIGESLSDPQLGGPIVENRFGEDFAVVHWLEDRPSLEEEERILREAIQANDRLVEDAMGGGEDN